MKRLLIFALSFALTGCAAIAPASPTPGPTSTPQVVMQTVVVTVVVTQLITETPSTAPTATLTSIPTFTPGTTATAATGTAPTTTSTVSTTPQASGTVPITSATATLPADAGGSLFTNLTRSSDHLALNCQPNTITFGLSATDPKVSEVDLFYRVENQSGSSVSGWVDIGKMTPDPNGNFTMDFPATRVDPDLRSANAWIDYQFVGLDKAGNILGRSAKIVRQITFLLACPG